jgi:large subunit ribosomal protein L13
MSNTVKAMHTIDAEGKRLGRVASVVAHLLMEKDTPTYEKHMKSGARVHVTNAGKMAMTNKRAAMVRYARASGYPGNLKKESIEALRARRGVTEVVRRAVSGMLPNNKLRPATLKRLTISD